MTKQITQEMSESRKLVEKSVALSKKIAQEAGKQLMRWSPKKHHPAAYSKNIASMGRKKRREQGFIKIEGDEQI